MTAENLATQYNISRGECDEFALRSQVLWGKAHDAGIFKSEIVPIELKGRKGPEVISVDEHPRPLTKIADLNKLKPVFQPDGGRVTAGSASGICDGAASLIVAGEEGIKESSLTALTRIVAWCRVGCEPTIMGIGPVPVKMMP